MACGFTASFGHLLAARIGVAAAEGGLTPAALATLSDRFDNRRLATATSLYMLAPFVGGGLALSLGGALYAWAARLGPEALLPRLGFEHWQIVFLIIGALGFVPALLLLLIRDRRGPEQPAAAREAAGKWEVFALFRREWKIYVLYPLAMALVMIVLASYVTWLPAAIMRSKGIDEVQIGALFGPIYTITGVVGTLSAGFVIMLRAGDNPVRAVIRYMLLMLGLLWPLASLGLLTDSLGAELAMMGLALFLISSVTSLSSLPYQFLTPRHLRAQAMALMAMLTALIGTGLGPVIAGLLSDHLKNAAHPLSIALAALGAVCVPGAFALLWVVLQQNQRKRLDLVHGEAQA
jgi:MFS family permease